MSLFDEMLEAADQSNRQRKEVAKYGHLPTTMEEGHAYFRGLIRQHHALMLEQRIDEAVALRQEARDLAYVLNGFEAGTHAHDEAPGYVLEREAAAPPGEVPLWGQSGKFLLPAFNAAAKVSGMLGLFATHMQGMAFEVYAADNTKPFLSETGYRSFLGQSAPVPKGSTVDVWVAATVQMHINKELKGRLKRVEVERWAGKGLDLS